MKPAVGFGVDSNDAWFLSQYPPYYISDFAGQFDKVWEIFGSVEFGRYL
jgi:hypothetical protein